jgi:pilus assembly protein CpaB
MKKFKIFLPAVMALLIAAVGSYLVFNYVTKRTAPQAAVKVEAKAVPVAVAAIDLAWGTKLTSEMVTTAKFLQESLPPGYTSDSGKLVGRVMLIPVKKNEPITESRLAPTSVTSGGVSAVVNPGKRAIAVKGDKVIGISGFINPGNRVDVLVTLTDPRDRMEVTKLVLENILVLASGTQIQENAKGDPAPVDVYTLEVTPEEAEKLSLAATQGRLQFALRNPIDAETVRTRGATIPKTLASLRVMDEQPKVSDAKKTKKWRPRRKTITIEVIKGTDVKKKKFKL